MEFLVEYKEQILLVASFFVLPILVFFIALAVVFLLGRMLELVKSNRGKNTVAFLAMLVAYVFYFKLVDGDGPLVNRIWRGTVYVSCTIILYVLFGFKLYDRFDDFMDRHFGKDRPERTARKKRVARK
jgi:hypothetical protein